MALTRYFHAYVMGNFAFHSEEKKGLDYPYGRATFRMRKICQKLILVVEESEARIKAGKKTKNNKNFIF